jgi:hypothetical protein
MSPHKLVAGDDRRQWRWEKKQKLSAVESNFQKIIQDKAVELKGLVVISIEA